jgi:hypothetical protein
MKRCRTGRAAPPWAGGQTGPMTANVEALMSRREFAQNSRQIHTPPAVAALPAEATVDTEADEPTGPSAIVKLVYVGPGSSPECERTPTSIHTEGDLPERADPEPLQRQGTVSTVPHSANQSGVSTPEAKAIPPKRSHHKRKHAKRKPRPIATLKEVTLRPAAPPKQSQPKTQTEIDISHHQRRCSICHHPEREAIEEAFLQWRRVKSIDLEFKPEGGRTAIYRHARALNLFKQRNLSLRSSLEFVIEQAEHVMPTAEGLVKAIRAYTRINDQGEWIDTPTTHIVKVMPMRDPEPRNVTNSASGGVTLDVKQISNCPSGRKARGEGKVEVTIESPRGRPFLTGSPPQTEIDANT